ncbi:MAG: aldo/keto reductase, partial [Cyanobacteria bacterium J06641_5]
MRYRRFGQTGQSLSVFSLGTMRSLSGPEPLQRVVAAAWERGINHFETARGYGSSEAYLGQALRALQLPRARYFLTTKLLPTHDAARFETELAESCARLQCDRVDFLAFHGINTWEHLQAVCQPQIQAAVARARADGRIGHVGFSTHAPLEIVSAAIETGLFAFVNLHYYYFDRQLAPAIALAAARDLGVFIISPADKGGRLYNPPAKLRQLCAPFSPLTLTYRFLLGDRRITTLSLGPATPAELVAPLEVGDRDGPLAPAERDTLARLEAELRNQLGDDYCQQCRRCLPCPEAINIPAV